MTLTFTVDAADIADGLAFMTMVKHAGRLALYIDASD